jgi:hypothetical protein
MKMSVNTARLAEALRRTAEDLKTVRDETRVQAHLAGREAKDKWRTLEDRIGRVTDDIKSFGEATARSIGDLKSDLTKFREKLGRGTSEREKPRRDWSRKAPPIL